VKLFKRASISIKRKLWENLLLLSVIMILGMVISGAFSIFRAVNHTESNLRRSMPTTVSIHHFSLHYLAQFNDWDERDAFIHDVIYELGHLPYVSQFEYTFATTLQSPDLRNYQNPFPTNIELGIGSSEGINLRGFSNPNVIYLEAGNLELIAGRTFTEDEINIANDDRSSVAIISQQFATYNQLWLGDVIKLNAALDENAFEMIEYEFEIIGIRDFSVQPVNPDPSDYNALLNYSHNVSRLFVPNWIVTTIDREFDYYTTIPGWDQQAGPRAFQPHWVLRDPQYLDEFKAIATELLPENWDLLDYSNRFGAISYATDMLLQLTRTVVVSTVISVTIILSLLITLFLYDRRYEIGIYLSLGEKKSRIICQILIETMLIFMIGITLALFIGNLVSHRLSNYMLRNEIAHQFETTHSSERTGVMEFSFGLSELTPEEMLAAFDTSLNAGIMISFATVGFLIVIISTLAPIMYVVKLSPKKILT